MGVNASKCCSVGSVQGSGEADVAGVALCGVFSRLLGGTVAVS